MASATQTRESKEFASIKEELDAQPKFTVVLHQAPVDQPQLPDMYVGVNGFGYQIQRNKPVAIPESVYRQLVAAGHTPPQRAEDFDLVPKMTYRPGVLHEQVAANVQ